MTRVRQTDADFDSHRDRLVFALRERILRGGFGPGERLTELGLAPQFGTSRTPIRLALEHLSHDGLLEALPSGGFRVRAFTVAEILDAIEIRGVLEGTAVRFAAERLESVEELQPLKSLLTEAMVELPVTMDSFARYLERNDRFHRELWRLAKSVSLARALEAATKIPFAAPGSLVFTAADRDPGIALVAAEHHRAIVDAIEHHEGTRAEALAREHSRLARRNLQWALQQDEALSRLPGAALITT